MMLGKGNTPPLLVGVQTCTNILEISIAISLKIREQSTSRAIIPLLGIYAEDALSHHKDMCQTMLMIALFIIAKPRNSPNAPHPKNG